jgi:hypothetical protein
LQLRSMTTGTGRLVSLRASRRLRGSVPTGSRRSALRQRHRASPYKRRAEQQQLKNSGGPSHVHHLSA